MTSLANLLDALKSNPTDAALRLVAADAADDAGRPEEAALLRISGNRIFAYQVANIYGIPADLLAGASVPGHPVETAEEWIVYLATIQGRIDAHRVAEQRKADWLRAAEAGDANALLCHPESRQALRRLANGEKPTRWGKKASDYTTSRKAIAAAKALLASREERVAARKVAEAARAKPADLVRLKHLAKLRERAVEMGREYHRKVRKLYQSAYGDVLYGRGGQETSDRERYSKGYHNSFGPARNLNGGARLDSNDRPTCVIMENFRGTEVARLPLSEGR